MALSVLRMCPRMAMRPKLLGSFQIMSRVSTPISAPMASSAQDQMKAYWEKNLALKRPNSPWTAYKMRLPMITSLTHRITGITLSVILYGASVMILAVPADWASIIAFFKSYELGPIVWFPMKLLACFPFVYHYCNGIRHLYWDYKGGYEMPTQYKSGYTVFGIAGALSLFLAAYAYTL